MTWLLDMPRAATPVENKIAARATTLIGARRDGKAALRRALQTVPFFCAENGLQISHGALESDSAELNARFLALAPFRPSMPISALTARLLIESTLEVLANWQPSAKEAALFRRGGLSAKTHFYGELLTRAQPVQHWLESDVVHLNQPALRDKIAALNAHWQAEPLRPGWRTVIFATRHET